MAKNGNGSEEAAGERIHSGVLKKVSAKDPNKYIVECFDGSLVQMPASQKPDNVELGDEITFTLRSDKPLTTWVAKAKKRKSGPEEVYTGRVIKPSEKQPSLYIVECPVVTEWYGIEARLPGRIWPDGLELGGDIMFSIKETPGGKPLIAWAEVTEAVEEEEEVEAEPEPQAKVRKQAPPRKEAEEKRTEQVPTATAELRMNDVESAIEAWDLDGSTFDGMRLSVVHHPDTEDGLKFEVSGVRNGTSWQDLKEHFRQAGEVAYCRVTDNRKPTTWAEVRFHDPYCAEASLQLYGTVVQGDAAIRVELDSKAPGRGKVRVYGVPLGFSSAKLREYFEEIGEVAFCKVYESYNDKPRY